jgi:hypothetical protein
MAEQAGQGPARRRRWSVTPPGRPSWWEVPPHGYLEVESRHSPTRPRALRTLARTAVKAGLSWSPDQQLPVQSFVAAQERARLVFHARRELPRVTAVASQVMVVDSRLAEAEELLDRTVRHRESAAEAVGGDAIGPATPAGPSPAPPGRRPVLGPWSQAAVLVVVAGGQGLVASVVGRDLGLGALAVALFSVVGAVGVVAAAQLAARGLDRLGATPDGTQRPDRRRRLEVAVAAGALACGVLLAVAMGYVTAGAGRAAVSLALLGLATAVCYTAIPDRPGADPRQALVARLRRLRRDRRSHRRLRAALARESAAEATVRHLREQLAVLVPQLFAAEQAALLFWRYQVAIGDAAQHAFEQHLATFSMRRSRGVWRPIRDWWCGAAPAVPEAVRQPPSVGAAQSDWGDQVARVTMAAKRVLVRRGLLDITHGLRLPALPGALAEQLDGGPAGNGPEAVAGDGHRTPALEGEQPGER